MANNVADLYISKFNMHLVLLAQQRLSRFRNWVTTGSHKGKQASPVDQLAQTSVQQRTSRFSPIVLTDIVHSRRWVQPISFETHAAFDNFDQIRMNVNPSSGYLKTQINAMNREIDDSMIVAHFGTAVTGEDGGDTVTFATEGAGEIAVAASDLTVSKLLAARQLLLENEVDLDDPEQAIVCIMTPHQENTLINAQEINNADFGNTVFDKSTGLHNRDWFGIHFIVSNRLLDGSGVRATDNAGAATDREIPFYAMSGMHLGLWDDVRGVILNRPDLSDNPPQMSVYATFGSTRIEGPKMVRIICDET